MDTVLGLDETFGLSWSVYATLLRLEEAHVATCSSCQSYLDSGGTREGHSYLKDYVLLRDHAIKISLRHQ